MPLSKEQLILLVVAETMNTLQEDYGIDDLSMLGGKTADEIGVKLIAKIL